VLYLKPFCPILNPNMSFHPPLCSLLENVTFNQLFCSNKMSRYHHINSHKLSLMSIFWAEICATTN
uniref:Uncharacterized protein n=1 Tax=Gouania willdenowi TaxID=441366 RepID=A0A8C5HAU9_GOUWI